LCATVARMRRSLKKLLPAPGQATKTTMR
jgi:hypothetical protein